MKKTDGIMRFCRPKLVRCFAGVILMVSLSAAGSKGVSSVDGEGPEKTGSEAYREAGANGNGIRIAIFDNGFCDLTLSQGNGDAPIWDSIVDTAVFSSGGLTDCGTTHGTKIVEVAYDHAPGATYCLYKVASGLSASDLNQAVDAAIDAGADIISMSITFFNQGWEDGSGEACAAVERAADAGILVFAAAGNFAVQHWRGPFTDPENNDLHNWQGLDEFNNVTLLPSQSMPVYLQWDVGGGAANYDLYIYDQAGLVKKDSSKHGGNTPEDLTYVNTDTVNSEFVSILVRKVSGADTDLQLFARRSGGSVAQTLEHLKSGGSISSPANSEEPNVISVGAVDWDDYDSLPSADGVITYYSSLGPTNSGRIEPDLVAPTNCSTSVGRSGGTSGATPNAAGTAAAFWSASKSLSASGIRHLLLDMAEIFKDWGVAGNDTIYGRGGIRLPTYHVNTVWVDPDAGNTDGSDTIPYYYLFHAQDSARAGGRIVFLGNSYPEPIILNKRLLYETIGGPAILGK